MTIDEIALRIFCAMLADGGKVSTGDDLGRQQIEIAFMLAETFGKVDYERRQGQQKLNIPLPKRMPDFT